MLLLAKFGDPFSKTGDPEMGSDPKIDNFYSKVLVIWNCCCNDSNAFSSLLELLYCLSSNSKTRPDFRKLGLLFFQHLQNESVERHSLGST